MMVMTAPVEFDMEVREELYEAVHKSSSMFADDDDEVEAEPVEGVDYRMVRGQRFPIRMNSEAQVANIAGPMVAKR
jgi:hypothetical protein